jgi:hypothetical protein
MLGGMLRPGSAGSNTAADHIPVLEEAIATLPPTRRCRLMVTVDGAGASHDLVTGWKTGSAQARTPESGISLHSRWRSTPRGCPSH